MIQHIELLTAVDYKAKLRQCIHCGLCLSACPTYVVFGTEMDGPRGRIALMRAMSEGRIEPSELNSAFAEHITRCLACRACETACPSGVQYGWLVESARITIEHNRTPSAVERFGRWLGLRQLMPHPGPLKFIARLIWLYQVTGLQSLVRAANILPRALAAMESILPPITPRYRDYRLPAPALGKERGRVAFFIGCIQEAFLAPVNEATIRVLQRNGYEVDFPHGQTCCGAAQAHVGEDALARDLARQNIDAFLAQDFEAIITNAGGCGFTLKEEYPHWLENDPVYAERARRFSAQVKDINEFLADHLHVLPTGEVKARATYSDSCHLRHGQKVVEAPRDLLRRIPGLQLVELKHADQCCGSAGLYNIVQADTANAVLEAKMADIAATGADLIVTSNPGCHLQLIAGVRHAGLRAKVMHVAEVLDWSYTVAED
jgi:glycolate oxidase iron-sulfur subunit